MPLLEVQNLNYTYSGNREICFPNFHIEKNALISGPSGVGKTTLLHLIGGLKRIQKGSIKIDQKEMAELKGRDLDEFRTENIGIVFQKSFFISSLNLLENVLLPTRFVKSSANQKKKGVELLQYFGLEDKLRRKIGQLSEGEQQRASIARAFLNHPKLVIADEPTSSLDDANCKLVIDQIQSISEKFNSTFVIVSHDHRLDDYFKNKIILT